MANEFIIKNGYFSQGSSNITGSLNVTAGITGSLFGTASNATGLSALNQNVTITGSLTVTQDITGSGLLITGSTTTDLVRITQTGTGNAFVVEDSTNPDSTPFVVSNAGNVGIGTTTPSAKFEIKSAAQNNLGGLLFSASGSTNYRALIYESSNNAGVIELYSGASLTTRLFGNGFSYFNGGNVGIGTTSPNAKLDINGNTLITGSLTVTNDLIVLGSASVQYITSSQLNINDNIISVNTITPAVRFGGLAVIDSGSSPIQSGSLLFDSQNNQWIFVHQSAPGAAVTSSMLLMGPQTFNNIGNETALTANRVPKSSGADLGEHLTDSNIEDTGTLVNINSTTYITGGLITYFDDTGTNPGLYTPVLDTVNSSLYTYEGASFSRLSIEYGATRALYDLQGPGQQISLNWGNRNLVNTNGTNVLNWNNGITISGSTLITGSLGITGSLQVQAYDASIASLYPQIDSVAKTINVPNTDVQYYASVDWGNQQLNTYDVTFANTVVTVDWSNRILNTAGSPFGITKPSVDWGNRYLRYSNTTVATPPISINWGAGTLNDISGSPALRWNTPGTLTVTGSLSITGSLSVTSVGNNTGSFVTINGNNTLNSRTAAQVRVDINYYGLTYAMQNGYY
jgi:hypothetical protein